MPLYLNDEIFEVPKHFKKQFEDSGNSMIFRLDKRYVYYDDLNKKFRSPNSVGVEAATPYIHEGNPSVLRWAKSKTPVTIGGVSQNEYTPTSVTFDRTKKIAVRPSAIDLAYLLFVHQENSSNPNRDKSKKTHFYLENLKSEAVVKSKVNKLYNKALNVIWEGDDSQVLIDTAKMLGFSGVDRDTIEMIQNKLDDLIKDPKGRWKKMFGEQPAAVFLRKLDGADRGYRVMVQDAVDYGVVVYQNKKREWVILEENNAGKKMSGEVLTKVRTGDNRVEALVKYFMRSDTHDTYSLIEERVMEAKNLR